MSEEIRNQNTELNDAALEGVSGGKSIYEVKADDICRSCPRYRNNCGDSSSRWGELVDYMKAHGILYFYYQCPFYND